MEIQFRSLKHTAVIRIRKILSNFPFLSKRYARREQCVDVNNPLQTVFKHFKLYRLAQIVWEINYCMLTNVLVNICSEISKIWLILWMVYACKKKGLEEVEKLGRLVEMNILCIVDQDYQWWVIAVDHTSKFEVI